jgi:photosystem II stability/assembly factor-like uncharacterized protein
MSDPFTSYETGLKRLLERLGSDHPRYTDALSLEAQLRENINLARSDSDSENRRADRNRILRQLNALTIETVGVSFNELCKETVPPPPPLPPPSAPFVGLRPFRSEDRNLFFGREQYLRTLVDELLGGNSPILVLNGPSGAGKSSLLAAGLVPLLRERGYAVAYASILDSPQSDVIRGIWRDYPIAKDARNMVQAVNLACSSRQLFFLIIDQFERCFTLTRDNEERLEFWRGIGRLVRGETQSPLKLVVAVRADWLYAFQKVEPPLDIPVFSFLSYIDPLGREEAKQALIGPLKRLGIAYDSALIDLVISDLASPKGEVNPPQLQVVGSALYRHMKEHLSQGIGKAKLTLQDYKSLHGTEAILRSHLVNAVEHLGPNAQTGWQILLKLVGPGNQRVSRRAEDLRGNLSPPEFNDIIRNLVAARLVVQEYSSADETSVFTLTHDYLIEEISNHFEKSEELQAWKRAEQYLNIGLADWRDAKNTTGQELMLERERYLHIWSQIERLGDFSEEANELLLRSGLYHGESSFGYWLAKLPVDHCDSALKVIRDYCLYQDVGIRQAAQKAVIKAIRENQMSDDHQKRLKGLLLEEFQTVTIEETKEDKQTESLPQPDTVQLTRTERKQSTAIILWALRRFTKFSEKLRFAPIAGQVWATGHKQIIMAIVSVLLTIVVILAALGIRESLKGKWYPVHTLFAGPISGAAIAPDKPEVYIVTQRLMPRDGATLLWRQGGDDWKILSRNFIYDPINSLLVTYSNGKRRIYVSVKGRGILRSDNNGANWELINTGLRSYDILVLVADPLNPDVIYAGSSDQRGIFETWDGGNSWLDISGDELFGASVLSMVYTPYEQGAFLAGTADGRILSRTRNGPSWQLVSAYPGVGAILKMSVEPEKGQYVYAGTSNGNVLVSLDGGAGWVFLKRIPGVFAINSIRVVPGKPNVVYMDAFGVGGNILWKSEDCGQNWRHVLDDQFTREEIGQLLIPKQEPDRLYAAGLAGLFETQDGGNSWTFYRSIGSPLASVDNIAVSPFDDGPIYASVRGAVYSISDLREGIWERGHGLLADDVRDIVPDPTNPTIAYAGVYLPNKWSVFVTVDGGKTWQPTTPPLQIPEKYLHDATALDIAKIDSSTILYAGTNGCGVIHTTDQGVSWEIGERQDCLLPGNAPKNIQDLVIDPHSANSLYVAADDARFFVTEDRGQNWQSYPTPLTTEITAIGADPEIEGRVYLIAGAEGFWRSDDSGKTWRPYSKGLEERSLSAMVVVPDAAETLFVGATSGEVWETTDGGQNWKPVRENLAVTDISVLVSGRREAGILLGSLRDGIYQYQPGSLPSLQR